MCVALRVQGSNTVDLRQRLVVIQQSTPPQGHISFGCACDPFGRKRGTGGAELHKVDEKHKRSTEDEKGWRKVS